MSRTKEERKAYKKAYYQAHKEQCKAKKKAYYQAHKEEHKAHMKAYYQAYKEEHKAHMKAYYQIHKEEAKAYRQAHKEEKKAYSKSYRQAHKAYQKVYTKSELNSLGQTKHSIRKKSQSILKKSGIKIPGYQIHHCFTYNDPSKFIYCSKETHLKIHQYLRDNNIDADSDHYEQIKHLLDENVVVFGV